MKRILLLVVYIYVQVTAVMGDTYYLSANGNDSNSGKSVTSPWCTVEKLTAQMSLLKPGDSIVVERGSSFTGTLTLHRTGIYFGAYGVGAMPVFTGVMAITQWDYFGNNIWAARCAECDDAPGNLFINGKPQVLGRYPNNHLLTISGATQQAPSLSDTSLAFPDGYWNTAEVVVRSSRWTYDNLTVTQYTDKTFRLTPSASYPLVAGVGYFIQRHISTLDQHGEWYFNSSDKMLYVYLQPGEHPDHYAIDIGVHDSGLTLAASQAITVENLIFSGYTVSGISVVTSSFVTLSGVEVRYSGKNGMDITSSHHVKIENCRITDSNNNGVQWHNTTQSQFIRNQVCRTGLYPGRGESGNGTYLALYITSDLPRQEENLFQYNTIDSVGYSAIDFRTGNTTIKDNIISNFCLVKDDGAGIYTWNNTQPGNIIEANSIRSGIGSGIGTLAPTQHFAHGIYIDDRSKYAILRDNVIHHCSGSGIFLHNAKNISVLNNFSYSNGLTIANQEKGELYIRIDTLGQFGSAMDMELIIEGNTWMANETTHGMYVSVEKKTDVHTLGSFNTNHFAAMADHLAIAVMIRQAGTCRANQVTLQEWQQDTKHEEKSIFTISKLPAYCLPVGNDKIVNGEMTENSKGWTVWPETTSINHEPIETSRGGSLKIGIPAGNAEALFYQEGISFQRGKLYRLTFTAMSSAVNQVEFVPLMAHEPWLALGAYTCFVIGPERKTFTYYFIAEKSSTRARVNFKSRNSFSIDHVSLYEVAVH